MEGRVVRGGRRAPAASRMRTIVGPAEAASAVLRNLLAGKLKAGGAQRRCRGNARRGYGRGRP
eukprot:5266611-Lingulodinium_polyedra.AAC.1